jgi:hypothetical protein
MKKIKDSNFEIEWWNKWYEADNFEREKLVRKLPILNEMFNKIKFDKDKNINKILIEGQYNLINSYFEDLSNYMRERIRLENNKKHKCLCGKEFEDIISFYNHVTSKHKSKQSKKCGWEEFKWKKIK